MYNKHKVHNQIFWYCNTLQGVIDKSIMCYCKIGNLIAPRSICILTSPINNLCQLYSFVCTGWNDKISKSKFKQCTIKFLIRFVDFLPASFFISTIFYIQWFFYRYIERLQDELPSFLKVMVFEPPFEGRNDIPSWKTRI